MSTAAGIGLEAPGRPPSRDSDRRAGSRSRLTGAALVLVLLGVSLFAVWTSRSTSNAAKQAIAASRLSDDYADAATAVASEESLEHEYRLEPAADVRTHFEVAAAGLSTALSAVRRDGDHTDRALVDRIRADHLNYLGTIDKLFNAVDAQDLTSVQRIDKGEVNPSFGAIAKAIAEAAEKKHLRAMSQLARLQRLEAFARLLTPVVFVAGLLLAGLLASITRGHRRALDVERGQAVHDSLHDALTGLPNRTLLADRFGQALLADVRNETSTGLLLLDLDRFKDINDTFGHHYGDEVLTQVGPRLTSVLREVDTVARLGGDEFAVLLPGVRGVDAAAAIAAKLLATLEAPFRVENVDLDVEASVGVVVSGEHGVDSSTLLQRADIAMYVAKAQDLGVFVYDPAADGHSPAKLALLGDLRRGLDRGELVLHYQPKVSISTGEVVGAEALVRWRHPDRGMVFPDAFIPLAEHTGLIGPLTRFVLDSALEQARRWTEAGRTLSVSVNLSARNLLDDHLPAQVAELLSAHGVAADVLELEVTESAIMTDPVRAQHILEQLSSIGVRISIDDFGVGYTSLGQLKTMPVSELKIDRSFVMTMIEDRSNAVIVQSVIDLGHNLGLTIVAEGVEDEHVLAALAGFGCDVAQGYHLARPMTVEAFDTWYDDRLLAPVPTASSGPAPTQLPNLSAFAPTQR